MSPSRPKAIALLSGGLDSTLAVRLLLEQGVEVIALNFFTPFCCCNRGEGCKNAAKAVAQQFGIEARVVPVGEEYLRIVANPKHGRGSNMNPCLDCRILMHRNAKELMAEVGAEFVVTGEVLGQRPMSQHRRALQLIERESGLEGLVVRPLSAQLFRPTIPEQKGWVDRERLLSISGRSRKPQMQLADHYGLEDYPCPAGGCLLTDPGFARKVRDLVDHQSLTLPEVKLLKLARHFRLSPTAKLIVGRDEVENNELTRLAQPGDHLFEPVEDPGPTALGRGELGDGLAHTACAIVARYTDGHEQKHIRVEYRRVPSEKTSMAEVEPADSGTIDRLRV